MTRRTLCGWTVAGLLMTGCPVMAKPPELPASPASDGRVPTPMEQDHYQPAKAGEPKLLPVSILNQTPGRHELPTATGSVVAALTQTDNGILLVAGVMTAPAREATKAKVGIDVAPQSESGQNVGKILGQTTVTRFADFQTAEPPFADKDKAGLELSAIQLKVLWEAARQYREAVREGDEKRIGATGRTLDAVLRQTKSVK